MGRWAIMSGVLLAVSDVPCTPDITGVELNTVITIFIHIVRSHLMPELAVQGKDIARRPFRSTAHKVVPSSVLHSTVPSSVRKVVPNTVLRFVRSSVRNLTDVPMSGKTFRNVPRTSGKQKIAPVAICGTCRKKEDVSFGRTHPLFYVRNTVFKIKRWQRVFPEFEPSYQ